MKKLYLFFLVLFFLGCTKEVIVEKTVKVPVYKQKEIKIEKGSYPVAENVEKKGKIAVLIESHFDDAEYSLFKVLFPKKGYEVDFVSYLWGNDSLVFTGNENRKKVEVTKDINSINLNEYSALILIGGYAMDRLRYQPQRKQNDKNLSPAVEFLRKAVNTPNLKIGTICHSLWLFTASPDLIKGKKVTAAHNIVDDVINAGGLIEYSENNETKDIVIDGNLISCQHPDYTKKFISTLIQEIEK